MTARVCKTGCMMATLAAALGGIMAVARPAAAELLPAAMAAHVAGGDDHDARAGRHPAPGSDDDGRHNDPERDRSGGDHDPGPDGARSDDHAFSYFETSNSRTAFGDFTGYITA